IAPASFLVNSKNSRPQTYPSSCSVCQAPLLRYSSIISPVFIDGQAMHNDAKVQCFVKQVYQLNVKTVTPLPASSAVPVRKSVIRSCFSANAFTPFLNAPVPLPCMLETC